MKGRKHTKGHKKEKLKNIFLKLQNPRYESVRTSKDFAKKKKLHSTKEFNDICKSTGNISTDERIIIGPNLQDMNELYGQRPHGIVRFIRGSSQHYEGP
jgi:hypothetical protein